RARRADGDARGEYDTEQLRHEQEGHRVSTLCHLRLLALEPFRTRTGSSAVRNSSRRVSEQPVKRGHPIRGPSGESPHPAGVLLACLPSSFVYIQLISPAARHTPLARGRPCEPC